MEHCFHGLDVQRHRWIGLTASWSQIESMLELFSAVRVHYQAVCGPSSAPFVDWLSRVIRIDQVREVERRWRGRLKSSEQEDFEYCHHRTILCNTISILSDKKREIRGEPYGLLPSNHYYFAVRTRSRWKTRWWLLQYRSWSNVETLWLVDWWWW